MRWSAERLAEQSFGRRSIAQRRQQEVDSGTGGIDGAVEVTPTALDSNIGLIDPPGFVGWLEMTAQSLFQFGTVSLHPTPDRRVIRRHTALREQLFDIAQRERVAEIPAHGTQNQLWRGLPPLENCRSGCVLHGLVSLPANPAKVATHPSRGKNTQLPLADLLRQSVYSRLAGYEDLNDTARLSQDPTFRLIGSRKIWERGAALTSRLQSFETELLTQKENLAGLAALNRELIARAETIDSPRRIVLDMHSIEIPVYGQQEHSAYNGHFESMCYHPLLLFNLEGDCLAAKLRPGNVHSAGGWAELLLPEIARQQQEGKAVVFRADAAFAKPEIYKALEARDVKYAIRLPANDNLQRNITELLTRPVGRPSYKPLVWFVTFLYQAASWKMARRVVAKVEFHCGELFPPVGFIVTNLTAASRAVVRFYNKRDTAEQWIKQGKQAVEMTRLSCHRFRAN
jgi:hypothetical protein